MGSQSVTNFSAVRMKRIRELVKDYSPRSRSAEAQVKEIGAAAVGTLDSTRAATPSPRTKGATKGGAAGGGTRSAAARPANEFLQALSSRSVATAADLLISFAEELKETKDPQKVYEKYGIRPDERKPLAIASAVLTKAHSDHLSATQAETESAFAARDAIPKTIIDVVSRAFPHEKEPIEIDRKKFAEAFRRVPSQEILKVYLENVTAALINLVLDATRGSLPPGRIAEIKEKIRKRFVPKFIEGLKSK
jgi:hypothetical protein